MLLRLADLIAMCLYTGRRVVHGVQTVLRCTSCIAEWGLACISYKFATVCW